MNVSDEIKLLSIVVPVYNSEGTLEELCSSIKSVMVANQINYELILVDDYSRIETWKKLKEIKQNHDNNIKLIRLSKNFGQNNATLCGIDQSNGDWIVTIDDDLQFNPSDIIILIQKGIEDSADVVYGTVNVNGGGVIRKLGRQILKGLLKRSEGGSFGSSFRLIRGNIAEKLRFHSQDHLFINQIVSWYTGDIATVKVTSVERPDVKSGYSNAKLIQLGLKIILYYTSLPLKIIIYLSFTSAAFSFGFALYYFLKKVYVGTQVGYASLIVSIFIGTCIIMLSVGVLSLFVNRIYNARIKKFNYTIKKIS